jgi:hypothetical protein
MSWRDHQPSWAFKVGEYSNGDNPEGGVQDARSCFRTMGVSFKGTENGILDFLTLVNEG